MLKLNLGCGGQVVDGWVNVDYALGARLAVTPVLGAAVQKLRLFNLQWDRRIHIHDLTKPLPWDGNAADVCYTSHTVEHLSYEEGSALAREAFRVLKPGGVFRVVVPDLTAIVERYRRGDLLAEAFVDELGTQYGPRKRGLRRLLAPLVEYPHKCMYDTPAMLRLLTSAGFQAQQRHPFESRIADIRSIEIEARTADAVVVEGVKP